MSGQPAEATSWGWCGVDDRGGERLPGAGHMFSLSTWCTNWVLYFTFIRMADMLCINAIESIA
jgi:hypothetical protein